MTQLAIVTDLERCTGCQSCAAACAQENRLPPAVCWTRVYQHGPNGVFPELEMYYLPVACQHCVKPACVSACPTGASYKRSDGIVLIERDKCQGCRSCEKACPYHVHYFDAVEKKTQKCTLCAHLIDAGDRPACVKTCTTRALYFGDLHDPESEVSKLLANEAAHVLLPEAGTEPASRYILRRQVWRGGMATLSGAAGSRIT
jgi:molybdopterin-containing oxidoreductase family iron-sulfur binding subunit